MNKVKALEPETLVKSAALRKKGKHGMKPIAQRNFRCRESDDWCTDGTCTQNLCRAEVRSVADAKCKDKAKIEHANGAIARDMLDDLFAPIKIQAEIASTKTRR